MTDETDDHAEGTEEEPEDPFASELDEGIAAMGRVLGDVATRLLGSRVTQRPMPDRPTLSSGADALLTDFSAQVGQALHRTGAALSTHPSEPLRALDAMLSDPSPPLEVAPDSAPLTDGLEALGRGLFATTEVILDRIAPRRPPTGEE